MGDFSLEDIKLLLQKQTKELKEEFNKKIKPIDRKVEENTSRILKLEERNIVLERKLRKNNVIIFGLENQQQESLANYVIAKINTLFELNLELTDINNIYQLNRDPKSPVIIEFSTFLKKLEIFKSTEKLKELRKHKISVSNDMCPENRRDHKILRKHFKLAKESNKTCKIQGLRIQIEDKWYTAADLEYSPEENPEESEDEDDSSEKDQVETEFHSRQRSGQRARENNSVKRKLNHISPKTLTLHNTRTKKKK
ncbi:unnamed protein product [Ceutorhynchus assimilis]|uniref:Uncharacterized protein n=1 Tax=Ceutorhynchus assimilis TaxID=467358 RepID=A0A9N9MJN0_9CUCU|nr:unnamed protein product [Ceutorhynchus assimilis]